jgi:glutathione S-transferase
MQFYDTKLGLNPRRVRIFLAEKGVDIPRTEVDLAKLEHRSEAYSRLNPLPRTPALVLDDGTILTESVAICRYFEELHPDPPLFGEGALGKAQVEMWNRRAELNFLVPTAMAFRHTHPAMAQMEVPQIPLVAETSRPRVLDYLAIFDDQLARHEFVAGDKFSIADITSLVAADFLRVARIKPPETLSNFARWYAAVSQRPSARA